MNKEVSINIDLAINNDTEKIIISNPKNKDSLIKILIERKADKYHISKYTQKQVFNENIEFDSLKEFCALALDDSFKQLNAWAGNTEYMVKISKKGKCMFNQIKSEHNLKILPKHNRSKNYHLGEDEIIPPLIDMGIITKDGKIVNAMYDKYKQINKFIEIIDDAVSKYEFEELNIIDFGCGKSYLTFIVYYYLHEKKKMNVNIVGLDLKEEVIEKCNIAAEKYNYSKLKFEVGDIDGYKAKNKVDMVISLHACDTATDFALFNAINWNAKIIISVPCCQHELNTQLDSQDLAIVQRYGIIKERVSTLLTDSIRANLVECCGYKVQLLEFVDLSNTPKNLLIRATKANVSDEHKKKLMLEIDKVIDCFSFSPTLLKLLAQNNLLPYSEKYK